jgi:hypothetical protein
VRNNVSYVSTQKNQSTSEMNTDLDLNSAVEINFKSDYLPLNKLAGPGQAAAIRANSRNPDAEPAGASDAAREKRIADARSAETKRSDSLTDLLKSPARTPETPAPATTKPGTAGSPGTGAPNAGAGGANNPATAKTPGAASPPANPAAPGTQPAGTPPGGANTPAPAPGGTAAKTPGASSPPDSSGAPPGGSGGKGNPPPASGGKRRAPA